MTRTLLTWPSGRIVNVTPTDCVWPALSCWFQVDPDLLLDARQVPVAAEVRPVGMPGPGGPNSSPGSWSRRRARPESVPAAAEAEGRAGTVARTGGGVAGRLTLRAFGSGRASGRGSAFGGGFSTTGAGGGATDSTGSGFTSGAWAGGAGAAACRRRPAAAPPRSRRPRAAAVLGQQHRHHHRSPDQGDVRRDGQHERRGQAALERLALTEQARDRVAHGRFSSGALFFRQRVHEADAEDTARFTTSTTRITWP